MIKGCLRAKQAVRSHVLAAKTRLVSINIQLVHPIPILSKYTMIMSSYRLGAKLR